MSHFGYPWSVPLQSAIMKRGRESCLDTSFQKVFGCGVMGRYLHEHIECLKVNTLSCSLSQDGLRLVNYLRVARNMLTTLLS